MKQFDLFGRIKRTVICQSKHFFHYVWSFCKPQMYYKHPRLINRLWFASCEGRFPNFKHPKLFSEQLMAINLDAYKDGKKRQLRIQCADKYAVRQYVMDKGLCDILNDCYGVYDSFDDIDFDQLPNQFVLKMTNGSGQNYICRDKSKMDKEAVRKQFEVWFGMLNDFGLIYGEWQYTHMKPRIIAEKYLSTLGEDVSIIDYKFHCMHGKVYGALVCYDRIVNTHHVNIDHYTADWQLTDGVTPDYRLTRRPIPRPATFDQMKQIAETLSEGIEYVRVDLYEIDGKILFGEMTFTPAGNMLPYYTKEALKDMQKFYDAN